MNSLQGLVEEEKVDCFNIPNYMPSPEEVKNEVLKEGSFSIDKCEVSRIDWNFCNAESNKLSSNTFTENGHEFAKCVRSVVESLLIRHFGEAIIEELFRRYKNIIVDKMSQEKLELIYLTISLTKIK